MFCKFDLLIYCQCGGSITLQMVPGGEVLLPVFISYVCPNFQGHGHKVKIIFHKYCNYLFLKQNVRSKCGGGARTALV